MSWQTTIDSAGRLVLPKAIRDRLGLRPDIPVRLDLRDGHVVLSPAAGLPVLRDECGILVVADWVKAEDADHRSLRDERLEHLSRP
jgi:AbrB family looped-hinge helix DNA binding protein